MSTVIVSPTPNKQRLMDAKSEALLQQLVTATPAQIDAYLNANVTTLVQARQVLKVLAIGLRYVYLKQVQ